MDIRNHINLLANGKSQSIMDTVKNEIDYVNSFFSESEWIKVSLPPETQFTLTNIASYLSKAQQTAISMDSAQQRIDAIEEKAEVKKILEIEKELKTCNNPVVFGRMKRDLSYLKGKNSSEISKLVSLQQQLLVNRLNIIQVWKSLLVCEIHIMEESKKILFKHIWEGSMHSDDPEFQKMVEAKLDSIQIDPKELDEVKLDLSFLRTANMNTLRQTLLSQLDHVVSVERHIVQKKMEFMELSKMYKELKEQLPPPSIPSNASPRQEISVDANTESNPATKEAPPNKSRHTGMVFQDKKRDA